MEIERKIILTSLPDEVPVHHSTVEQIYISLNPEVRLRKNLDSDVPFRLTVKGDGTLCREEIETPAPAIRQSAALQKDILSVKLMRSVVKWVKRLTPTPFSCVCSTVAKDLPCIHSEHRLTAVVTHHI